VSDRGMGDEVTGDCISTSQKLLPQVMPIQPLTLLTKLHAKPNPLNVLKQKLLRSDVFRFDSEIGGSAKSYILFFFRKVNSVLRIHVVQ